MLKALSFGWFKNTQLTPVSSADVPKSFTIPGRTETQTVVVSMKEGSDEFVDIDYKKLSYAEAASLAKNKKQSGKNVPIAKPRSENFCENQYEVLYDYSEDDVMNPDAFKTNHYFLKNKVYKEADRTRKRRKSANKRS